MTVYKDVSKEDVEKLIKKGYKLITPKTVHEDLRLKKDNINLVHYTTGKLLVQGKDTGDVEEDLDKFCIGKKQKKISFRKEEGWIIGSDESLKGDTFGGLVVAAVKADDKGRKELLKIGVADSKKLNDQEILKMAIEVKKKNTCKVISILPEEYNKSGKVTELLNKLHLKCAKFLLPGKHVVDLYPGCKVGDIKETKAESKYLEVAAASVLARAEALAQMDYLSELAGFKLPKGSTHVKKALQQAKEKGLNFKKFVKVDFRNVQEFL